MRLDEVFRLVRTYQGVKTADRLGGVFKNPEHGKKRRKSHLRCIVEPTCKLDQQFESVTHTQKIHGFRVLSAGRADHIFPFSWVEDTGARAGAFYRRMGADHALAAIPADGPHRCCPAETWEIWGRIIDPRR